MDGKVTGDDCGGDFFEQGIDRVGDRYPPDIVDNARQDDDAFR